MKAINAAMNSFFLCSTGILTRLRVDEYTNTISSLYSVFYRIFFELHPCQDSRTGKAALNAE